MKSETIKYLENIFNAVSNMISSLSDEDLNWQSQYTDRSILDLISHLATLSFVDIKAGKGELKSAEEFKEHQDSYNIQTIENAINVLKESSEYALDHFKSIQEKNMDNNDVKFWYLEEPETNTHLLVELIEHLSIHRGILFSYMREMGYNAGMGTYYGFQKPTKS